MRKIIVLLILIVLAASAAAYVYIYQPFSKQSALESVLPEDTLATVRVCELKEQIERFRSNRMGQALAGMDWPNLLSALGVSEDQQQGFFQAAQDFNTGVDSLWFDVLFGKDFSVSILSGDIDFTRLEAGDKGPLLDCLVVVSRPSQPARILESLGAMFGSQLSVETEAFEQWEISRLPLEGGPPLYYALSNGLLIAGLSAEPVKACLRQSLDEDTSLLGAPIWRKHAADLYEAGRTDMTAFANMERLTGVLLEALDAVGTMDSGDLAAMKFKMQIENLRGIESLNLVSYDGGGSLAGSRAIVGLNRDAMSSYMSRLLADGPEKNPTLAYAPADALLYSWQNNFGPMLYWESMQNDPGMTPEMLAEIRQSFAMKTGMALEDLLSAFGSQTGFMVRDIDLAGMFPVPELALFVEVTKPEVIEALIGQLAGQSGMSLQREAYGDIDIRYLLMPLGEDLSPAYVYRDGFFTLAINRNLIKGMLEASDSGLLETHPHFEALGAGMTEESNSLFYARVDGLIEKTRELTAWGMSWMAMMQPDKARELENVMTLGVEPLLDGLSMVKAVGGRAYTEEDAITSEFQVLLDR